MNYYNQLCDGFLISFAQEIVRISKSKFDSLQGIAASLYGSILYDKYTPVVVYQGDAKKPINPNVAETALMLQPSLRDVSENLKKLIEFGKGTIKYTKEGDKLFINKSENSELFELMSSVYTLLTNAYSEFNDKELTNKYLEKVQASTRATRFDLVVKVTRDVNNWVERFSRLSFNLLKELKILRVFDESLPEFDIRSPIEKGPARLAGINFKSAFQGPYNQEFRAIGIDNYNLEYFLAGYNLSNDVKVRELDEYLNGLLRTTKKDKEGLRKLRGDTDKMAEQRRKDLEPLVKDLVDIGRRKLNPRAYEDLRVQKEFEAEELGELGRQRTPGAQSILFPARVPQRPTREQQEEMLAGDTSVAALHIIKPFVEGETLYLKNLKGVIEEVTVFSVDVLGDELINIEVEKEDGEILNISPESTSISRTRDFPATPREQTKPATTDKREISRLINSNDTLEKLHEKLPFQIDQKVRYYDPIHEEILPATVEYVDTVNNKLNYIEVTFKTKPGIGSPGEARVYSDSQYVFRPVQSDTPVSKLETPVSTTPVQPSSSQTLYSLHLEQPFKKGDKVQYTDAKGDQYEATITDIDDKVNTMIGPQGSKRVFELKNLKIKYQDKDGKEVKKTLNKDSTSITRTVKMASSSQILYALANESPLLVASFIKRYVKTKIRG